MINGLSEKEIIAGSGAQKEKLEGNSILHIYNDYADYESFMNQLSITTGGRASTPDDDVFVYIFITFYIFIYLLI